MGLINSAVVICHDEGYGDADGLMFHLRHAMRGKDMKPVVCDYGSGSVVACDYGNGSVEASDGVLLIALERKRQVEEECWTLQHDDGHIGDQLALAASVYALPAGRRSYRNHLLPENWPFDASYWRPSPGNRIKELVKAGALIAAEIDRLKRKSSATAEKSSADENCARSPHVSDVVGLLEGIVRNLRSIKDAGKIDPFVQYWMCEVDHDISNALRFLDGLRIDKDKYLRRECIWIRDEVCDKYDTQCKNAHCFVVDGLKQHGYKHCPFCGGSILELTAEEAQPLRREDVCE